MLSPHKHEERFLSGRIQKIRKFLKRILHSYHFLKPEIKLFECLSKFIIVQYPAYFPDLDVENLTMGSFMMAMMRTMMGNQTSSLFDTDDQVIKNNNKIGNKIHQLTISDDHGKTRNNEHFSRTSSSRQSPSESLELKPLLSVVSSIIMGMEEMDKQEAAQKDYYHPRSSRQQQHQPHELNNENHVMMNSKQHKIETHQSSSRNGNDDDGGGGGENGKNRNYKQVKMANDVDAAEAKKKIFLENFTFANCAKLYFFHLFLRIITDYIKAA